MIRNNTGYYHIWEVDLSKPQSFLPLTSGSFDVTAILGYHPANGALYFTSGQMKQDPTQSHVYGLYPDGNSIPFTPDTFAYCTASFSPMGTYFVLNYLGPNIPTYKLYSTPTEDTDINLSAPLAVIEGNEALVKKLSDYSLPTKTFITVTGQSGELLYASYILPPAVSNAIFYPTIFDIYGGPSSQKVTRMWSLGFDEFLASSDIIVASIDPRGTGNRGLDFMFQVYRQLGIVEAADIITAAEHVASSVYPIDYGRMGIWGWSYGGFMALNTIIQGGKKTFVTAVSVAPVTDWRLYDTFYTERYMSTPSNNTDGYTSTSVIKNAAQLKDFPFLLVHGTADDNVHFQNTAILNEILVELGIQYDTMFYTNQQHNIDKNGARPHLYQLMYDFIYNNLAAMPQVKQIISNN